MSTLFLCGAGNAEGVRLAQRVLAAGAPWQHLAILDDDPKKHGSSLLGVPILGPIDALADAPTDAFAVSLVARKTQSRAAVHRRIVQSGVPFANLVHPSVDVEACELGCGVVVHEQAIVSPLTRLGDGACVLMRAIVGHGVTIGANCVLAPGAVLNARVTLAERVYVGSNASVLPDIRVGDDVTIGANSMAAQDVPAGASVLGVPGQILLAATTAPDPAAAPAPAVVADPRLEAELLTILRGVLGHDEVGPNDNFFDVGGTSLRAVQFVEAVRNRLARELPVPLLFSACTMRRLAERLGASPGAGPAHAAFERAALRRRLTGRTH